MDYVDAVNMLLGQDDYRYVMNYTIFLKAEKEAKSSRVAVKSCRIDVKCAEQKSNPAEIDQDVAR